MPGETNLKDAPFLAKGDGATDDSDAIQNWLTFISLNSRVGVVPKGNYKVTRTMVVPRSDNWSIVGEGPYVSTFFFAGANANAHIFEIGDPDSTPDNPQNLKRRNSNSIHIRGVSIFSFVPMGTESFALKANRLANSSISDISFGGERYALYTGNGVWFNGAHQVFFSQFDCHTNGDGIRVNGLDPSSCSDLYINQGYSTGNGVCGIRCAGGFGGLYLDEVETLANGSANLHVDYSQPSAGMLDQPGQPPGPGPGNREIILGANYVSDGVQAASIHGILLDDEKAAAASVVCHGFIGSSKEHGVYIKRWPNSTFSMGSGRIFNNLRDGIYIEDLSSRVIVGDGVSIDNNMGWGIESKGRTDAENVRVSGRFWKNARGHISSQIAGWHYRNPAVTSTEGSFDSAECEVRWNVVGKTVNFSGHIHIHNNGSARGAVVVPLPFPAYTLRSYICTGRADVVSGKMLVTAQAA